MRQARRCRGRNTQAALHTSCTSHISPPVHSRDMIQNLSTLPAKRLATWDSLLGEEKYESRWARDKFWQCNIAHKAVTMSMMEETQVCFQKRWMGEQNWECGTHSLSLQSYRWSVSVKPKGTEAANMLELTHGIFLVLHLKLKLSSLFVSDDGVSHCSTSIKSKCPC